MKANVIVFDASMLILGVVFYYGMKRALGKSRGRAFIVGALSFALAIETLAVLCGVVNFYWYSINGYYKHYPLGGYIVWLGLVPLAVMLLFYIVSAASYVMATWVYRKQNIWARSAVAGVIAFLFYLMIEPVAVTNHWWTWNAKSFYMIDIPLFAWLGVFAAVFLFTLVYQMTVVEMSEPKALARIEKRTVRRWPLKCDKAIRDMNWGRVEGMFAFRLLLAYVCFCAFMAPVMAVLWAVANRGQIPPGW